MTSREDIAEGARNLLTECGEFAPGADVLIVCEDPGLGWYDHAAPEAVERVASDLGLRPRRLEVGGPEQGRSAQAARIVADCENVVFFARIGDQDRFAAPVAGKTVVMSYARDAAMLGSDYGRTSHRAMVALKSAVDELLSSAARVEISCPLGTRLAGAPTGDGRRADGEVSVRRFPMGVPRPVAAEGFSGRVALAGHLTPTGSSVYEPAALALPETVFATVEAGRMTALDGPPELVSAVRRHYDHVAELLGIDRDVVHSWHAGLHPASHATVSPDADPDRWSNTVFTSPRWLHFHTCGSYAPGEICWMVGEPTVRIDGDALWHAGRLRPEAFEPTRRCLEAWPALAALYGRPAT